ncbi:MAG: peptide-methionine (R)-S-oxide reductase MsrB [Pseudomonadota bacterium]|nr:peptide-methionine (R)-S-oxide reductase MsrB [Pseudomonadota bacterium]
MNRRQLLTILVGTGLSLVASRRALATERAHGTLALPASHWREHLSEAAHAVLFNEDTEPPRSSPLNNEKRDGTFICAACLQPLFSARTKFESGTGWPSFWQPLPDAIETRRDFKLIIPRTEYHCARCGGHQGHVFDDGPPPTGLRYCNNGLSLQFVPAGQALPGLRS